MDSYKFKIRQIVNEYIKLFPQEWSDFKTMMKDNRDKNKNDFGAVNMPGVDYIERKLFEIPETMHTIINVRLSDEEKSWWDTKEAGRWFAKTFREFSGANKT